ncbi:MAG: Rpn family recombination-promoting nuclease/putative transposase [Spirochaetaceae bacterium]|nr:Rpn family recombination-promoting nuclease/putative transposase [Spirochaetaceae bacterium]
MQDEKPTGENRKHKDSLFVDYFSKDRDWKQHFLSLYNALHGTNLQVSDTQLERVNLEQVLYKSYYNDIAVLVDGQFILMIEHQSTINPNMPLRLLEYVARIYGNIVDSKAKFSRHLVPLASPEFIVFYTGNQELPPASPCRSETTRFASACYLLYSDSATPCLQRSNSPSGSRFQSPLPLE